MEKLRAIAVVGSASAALATLVAMETARVRTHEIVVGPGRSFGRIGNMPYVDEGGSVDWPSLRNLGAPKTKLRVKQKPRAAKINQRQRAARRITRKHRP